MFGNMQEVDGPTYEAQHCRNSGSKLDSERMYETVLTC